MQGKAEEEWKTAISNFLFSLRHRLLWLPCSIIPYSPKLPNSSCVPQLGNIFWPKSDWQKSPVKMVSGHCSRKRQLFQANALCSCMKRAFHAVWDHFQLKVSWNWTSDLYTVYAKHVLHYWTMGNTLKKDPPHLSNTKNEEMHYCLTSAYEKLSVPIQHLRKKCARFQASRRLWPGGCVCSLSLLNMSFLEMENDCWASFGGFESWPRRELYLTAVKLVLLENNCLRLRVNG